MRDGDRERMPRTGARIWHSEYALIDFGRLPKMLRLADKPQGKVERLPVAEPLLFARLAAGCGLRQ